MRDKISGPLVSAEWLQENLANPKVRGYETRNYDGSWTEYGNAVGVPVKNPAGTVWTGK